MLHPLIKAILLCVFSSVCLCNKVETITLSKNVNVSAVFAFGDSFLDSGNNNYITTWTKANFLPYGKDFMGGKPTGRFTNGRTIADILSKILFPSLTYPGNLSHSFSSHKLPLCVTLRTKCEEIKINKLLLKFLNIISEKRTSKEKANTTRRKWFMGSEYCILASNHFDRSIAWNEFWSQDIRSKGVSSSLSRPFPTRRRSSYRCMFCFWWQWVL